MVAADVSGKVRMTLLRLLVLWLCLSSPAGATGSLLPGGARPLFSAAAPLVARRDGAASSGASLFAGRLGGSMFAPVDRVTVALAPLPRPAGKGAERLRHLIARAEAGPAGYDAVQHGAVRRPLKRPTAMTLAEIDAWIAATPGQPHAIGRYQFIPATLRTLVARAGLPPQTLFTPDVQDLLADMLLRDAGLDAVERGEITRARFMDNLAKIWAGLPTASGRSHYEGYAGNTATMSRAAFEREIGMIFPGER